MYEFNMKNPENLFRFVCLVVMFTGLSACQQTGTGSTDATGVVGNEEIAPQLRIFPDGLLDGGFTEEYAVTGVDEIGRTYTGEYQIETGGEVVFNGELAIPLISTLTYSTDASGQTVTLVTVVFTEYFSSSKPTKYLGNENSRTGVIMVPEIQAPIVPRMASASSSGSLGQYTGSDASKESIDWSVGEVMDNGFYDVGHSYLLTDSAGDVLSSENQYFTFDKNGNRTAWSFIAVLPYLGNTLNLTGIRL
jgi:hypothetical protein